MVDNQDVVQVYKDKAVQKVLEYIIEEGFTRSIGEAEQHDQVFKCPREVLTTVFHSSPSLILTRQYTFCRSNLVKMVAPCRGSKDELRRGKGYLYFALMLFRAQ